jgi:hypothetical protein
LALPTTTTGVVDIPQMVFTNPIMTIHVNRNIDRPLMSSMAIGKYKSAYVTHLKGGYQEPIIVTIPIFDHKYDHYVRPNMVALKYLDFKKDVNLDVHVRVFNSIIKANAKTSEEYIINVFNYMLKDMTSDWCHNYMLKFHDYIFLELTHAFCKCHRKTHNDEKIYMELKNMKQEETESVEVYYEWIQKLAHGLQVPTTKKNLTIMFRTCLQSYLRIVTTRMKWSTLQQRKEVAMLCEEGMITT